MNTEEVEKLQLILWFEDVRRGGIRVGFVHPEPIIQ